MDSQHRPPKIGISRCLLGDKVRYDGKSKFDPELIEKLQQDFDLLAICPEVEAGLPTPRPAVQMTGNIEHPRLTGCDEPNIDITEQMLAYCSTKPAELSDISGFIFKSRSPSCGMGSTPVIINGKIATNSSNGVFTRVMLEAHPDLPFTEETGLQNPQAFKDFKVRVFRYNARLK